jgi:hypothetical protein
MEPCPGAAATVRPADEREIGQLAQVWFDGWHEAHAQVVPPELTRLRTRSQMSVVPEC